MSDPKHPIATPTIARIYATQGKLEEAIALYERLIEATPEDETIARELAALRAKLDTRAEPKAVEDNNLILERAGDTPSSLRCHWRVNEDGIARARLVLGGDGQLTLRLMGFPADATIPPRDTAIDTETGSLTVAPPAGATWVTAAIGLLDDKGNFASTTHGDLLKL